MSCIFLLLEAAKVDKERQLQHVINLLGRFILFSVMYDFFSVN